MGMYICSRQYMAMVTEILTIVVICGGVNLVR